MSEADLRPPDLAGPARAAPDGKAKPRTFPAAAEAAESMAARLGKPTVWLYMYKDADGSERMAVARFDGPDGKTYRPFRKVQGGWQAGDPPEKLILYRLDELATAERVFVCEGEKAVDLVRGLGLAATTSAHGAKSPGKTDWTPLAGREVVILPDNDAPGFDYATAVAGLLARLRPQPAVKVVPLAGHMATGAPMPEGGDVEEWLSVGVPDSWDAERRRAELRRLADLAPAEVLPEVVHAEPKADEPVDEDWGPLRLGALPSAEPFPVEVLPEPARDLAEAAARSIACPVDFPAAACLAAASGAIGRSVRLRVKDGYHVSASLYLAVVGGPSSGKSPAIRAALTPLWKIGTELHERWKADKKAWEAADKDERGDEPTLGRVITTDPTTEALGPILAVNPRGMTIAPDEMTKWVMSMDQYKSGRGGDRPFYLSAWNGEPVAIDRAKNNREPIIVPRPFLTVAGGITPDMLTSLPEGRGRDDGFLARLLFAYPERTPRRYSEDGIPVGVAESWDALIRSLRGRPMREHEGRPAPWTIRMTPEAQREWADWCRAHYAEQEADDFDDSLEGAWGKLDAYAARLGLILHLIDLASDPTRPAPDDPPELSRRVILDAFRLVACFKAHARRVYASMGGKADDGGDDTRALLRWIVRTGLDAFSTRDIGRNLRRFRDDDAALADALAWLVARNAIRPRPEADSARRTGRKPSPSYEVNPALKTSPRFRQFRRNPAA